MLSLLSALILSFGVQADPVEVLHEVERLSSPDIREREQALRSLQTLDVSWIPALRSLAGQEKDPEARARLWEAVRHLAFREADRLFDAGRVADSLRAAVLADAAADPEAAVAGAKAAVAQEIRAMMPGCPPMEDDMADFQSLSAIIVDTYGPWGIGVLLDALAADDTSIPAVRLLAPQGFFLAGPLRRALAGPDALLRREASHVVHAMAFDYENLPQEGAPFVDVLESAAADPTSDPGTRLRCELILKRIRKTMSTRMGRPSVLVDGGWFLRTSALDF